MSYQQQAVEVGEPASQGGVPAKRRFLVCRPDFFGVHYVINPWMQGNEGRPRPEVFRFQWDALLGHLSKRAHVEALDAVEGLPDLVFTANAGLVIGKTAVLSRFRFPQRRPEEPVWCDWFRKHGFDIRETPPGVYFEGAGDALPDAGGERLWMGYGRRTKLEAASFLASQLGTQVTPLRLTDERFYHLDTCFAPLTGGYIMYYPAAFDQHSLQSIEELVPPAKRIPVGEADALSFACNAVDTGGAIIMNNCSADLKRRLEDSGFEVVRTPLSEFLLAGGAAKCLCLRLDEPEPRRTYAGSAVAQRTVSLEGHLLDSGMLARAMDRIFESGGDFRTLEFRAGAGREDPSFTRLEISAPSGGMLDRILEQLVASGAQVEGGAGESAVLREAEQDGVAPDGFYSTTIYPTEVAVGGRWITVTGQRMDGVVVVDEGSGASVRLIRDLRKGQRVVVGSSGVRIRTRPAEQRDSGEFKFMSSDVSSERQVETAIEAVCWDMSHIRAHNGRIVVVAGPVVAHTGGVPHLCDLVRRGYVQALLSGNALAVHDIELALFGTSLGVDLKRGVTVHGGHANHLRAINTIRRCGGIAEAVKQKVLTSGLMYELVIHKVPFCLAGSIRDDGPLPETRMDLVQAQSEYAQLAQGAEMILMLASMLHSIGVGNMTPAGVKMVCVDINAAVPTKLADRGSVEFRPVVTDVGLFLNLLSRKLTEADARVDAA